MEEKDIQAAILWSSDWSSDHALRTELLHGLEKLHGGSAGATSISARTPNLGRKLGLSIERIRTARAVRDFTSRRDTQPGIGSRMALLLDYTSSYDDIFPCLSRCAWH